MVSRKVYPITTFDGIGIKYIFRHGGIPLEFKKYVYMLAEHMNDDTILELAYDKEEIKCLM